MKDEAYKRGDVFLADLGRQGKRPVVLLTRNTAIPVLKSVTVAPVTTKIRGHVAELLIGKDEGLKRDSAVNCDNILTVEKDRLGKQYGRLDSVALRELSNRVKIALELE